MNKTHSKDTKIKLGEKEYSIKFTPNAIEKIQDKFNVPISQLVDLARDESESIKVLKSLFAILINESIDDSESGEPHVTEDFVGRKLDLTSIWALKDEICSTAGSKHKAANKHFSIKRR